MSTKTIIKRDGRIVPLDPFRISNAISKAIEATRGKFELPEVKITERVTDKVISKIEKCASVEDIQDLIINTFREDSFNDIAKCFEDYRNERTRIRNNEVIKEKARFIEEYTNASNAATGSKYDANANVSVKNIATLNQELPKLDAIQLNRFRVKKMLEKLYNKEIAEQYEKDLNHHIIYKHDETCSAIYPYCVAISMYPFLNNGLQDLGGLSAAPKNLDSFCGMFVNLLFAVSSQYMGAVATGEFFNCFDYYARKEWGDDYYLRSNEITARVKIGNVCVSVDKQIEQYFQQIVYSANQPAAARGFQSIFWNVSYFDSNYWEAMFENFYFPDGTQAKWESVSWLQKKFMKWFNKERTKCLLTFPVETMSLLSDGESDIIDKEYADFTAEMYSEGHSFFTYVSDSADSLSSCCRLSNKLTSNTFSFTNGLTGVATGSKSVITLNINRIVQDWAKTHPRNTISSEFSSYLIEIIERVYKYHIAYNELLKELYVADMLPVYKAGFINLNQQYLTIGVNGMNEAAEYLELEVSDNYQYERFTELILTTIADQNKLHKTKELMFNTEYVPAEGLGVKNAKWDKEDGYFSPRDCYNSYFYLPEDNSIDVIEKFKLHGKRYAGNLDGGVGLHCNLSEHLTQKQYRQLLRVAVKEGTSYFTFNIPNTICNNCGHIDKRYLKECPKCKSNNIDYASRIIGYLKRISNFSEARQIEASKRYYGNIEVNA